MSNEELSLINIQEILDENSKDIPDGLYIKLCNSMKKNYKEIKEKQLVTVKVYYNYPIVETSRDPAHIFVNVSIGRGERIIQIKQEYFEGLKSTIDEGLEFKNRCWIDKELCREKQDSYIEIRGYVEDVDDDAYFKTKCNTSVSIYKYDKLD